MKEVLSKRERVERTLNCLPVDRVAIHDHIKANPAVVSLYTGKRVDGFDYSLEDVCQATKKSMDLCRFQSTPHSGRATTEDGFVLQTDIWTTWTVGRPFNDTRGLKEYCLRSIERMNASEIDPEKERENYRKHMSAARQLLGDTVMIEVRHAPLRNCLWTAGLELFSFLYYEDSGIVESWLQALLESELRTINAIADSRLFPAILLANEIGSARGPIFSPDFLRKNHFPMIGPLVDAWHGHNIKVICEIQGNLETLIDDFCRCGVDGFYAIEPLAGMDIVELKKKYPKLVWACGIDGIDLMIRKGPEDVRQEVRREIEETDALNTGGLFIGTTSEINPPTRAENYKAMVEETKSIWNSAFPKDERE